MPFEHELDVARRAAAAGAAAALQYFRKNPRTTVKADESPVTEADLAAEKAILDVIRREFPADAILSEESGVYGEGGRRWLVDPIDGTRGFIRGLPHWGMIIGFENGGRIEAGVVHLPALGVAYSAATGAGCFRNDEKIRCADVERLEDATVQVGEMRAVLEKGRAFFDMLVARAAIVRSYGDCMAPCLVLEGRSDVWIEAGVKPWDLSPFPVLAREAGAVFTDWNGVESIAGATVLLSSPKLHRQLIEALSAER